MSKDDWFMQLDQRVRDYKDWLNGQDVTTETNEEEWWEDFEYYIENVAK